MAPSPRAIGAGGESPPTLVCPRVASRATILDQIIIAAVALVISILWLECLSRVIVRCVSKGPC